MADMTPEEIAEQRAKDNAQAGKQSKPATGTDTVTIGCKMPHGLILDMTEPGEPARRFVVKGNNSAKLIGGFGITDGVPRDFWNAWLAKNKGLIFVKQGLIFAYGKRADTEDAAEDRGAVVHGFEPMLHPSRPKPAQLEKAV